MSMMGQLMKPKKTEITGLVVCHIGDNYPSNLLQCKTTVIMWHYDIA